MLAWCSLLAWFCPTLTRPACITLLLLPVFLHKHIILSLHGEGKFTRNNTKLNDFPDHEMKQKKKKKEQPAALTERGREKETQDTQRTVKRKKYGPKI